MGRPWPPPLTDGGDVRGVELVVGEAAQQAGLAHPGIPNQQQPEQHIVLLRHGRDSRGPAGCGRRRAQPRSASAIATGARLRTPRWREGSGPAPELASPAGSLAGAGKRGCGGSAARGSSRRRVAGGDSRGCRPCPALRPSPALPPQREKGRGGTPLPVRVGSQLRS